MLDWTSQEPASWLAPNLLAALRAEGGGRSIHLVGGALRDRALGLPAADLDLVTDGDARQLAGALAARLGARLVDLGQERFAAYRLVDADGAIDLWGRGDTSIEADLERRDLTVNSIAIDLEDGALLDPFDGRADLEARLLRATTERSFREDPLRVLRLARFAATLDGFRIVSSTLELGRRDGLEVDRVAVERIRAEVARLLASPRRDLGVTALVATGLYPRLWGARGPIPDRHLTDRLARIETVSAGLVAGLAENLWEFDPTLVAQALLLAPLASARPTEATDTVATPLLIRRDRRRVAALLELGELPTDDAARRWLLRRWGPRWAEAAVFASLADSPAASPSAAARELASAAQLSGLEIFELAPLVSGTEVGRVLGVEPGPIIGRALAALEREQAAGRIASPRAARDFLRVWWRESADED